MVESPVVWTLTADYLNTLLGKVKAGLIIINAGHTVIRHQPCQADPDSLSDQCQFYQHNPPS